MKLCSLLALALFFCPGVTFAEPDTTLQLPKVGKQTKDWNGAPEAASRVLQYYKIPLSLEKAVATCPLTVNTGIDGTDIGPSPSVLAEYMNNQAEAGDSVVRFEVVEEASLQSVIHALKQKKPLILLLKVGEKPALLWSFFGLSIRKNLDVLNSLSWIQDRKAKFTSEELPSSPELIVADFQYVVLNGYQMVSAKKKIEESKSGFDGSKPASSLLLEQETEIPLFTYMYSNREGDQQISLLSHQLLSQWDWSTKSPFIQKLLDAEKVKKRTFIIAR